MTRDGLVDKNLSSGDESRISQRGQEFELRKHDQPEAMQRTEATARRPPNSIIEQLRTATENPAAYDPYSQDAGPEGLPMEAARPTARSHEARSHESQAGPKPRRRQAAFDTHNATAPPQKQGEYETTPDAPKTPYSEENQRFKHQFTTAETEPTPDAADQPEQPQPPERPSRLQYATGEGPQAAPDAKAGQRGIKYQRRFAPNAAKPVTSDPPAPEKSSRLQFTPDEQSLMPDKKLDALQNRAEKTAAKLDKARDKLPTRTRIKTQRVYDEAKGKGKTKLRLEKEIIPLGGGKKPNISVEIGKDANRLMHREAASGIHQKIAEVEKENVGVEAAHKLEQAAEDTYRGAKAAARFTHRRIREHKYRRVTKLEKKAVRVNSKLSYHKNVKSNPKLKKTGAARKLQKQKIRREYAKKARLAVKAAGRAIVIRTKALIALIKSNPKVLLIIVALLLIAFLLTSIVSSCSAMLSGGLGAVFSSSHLAEEADMDSASILYTDLETDLRLEIENAEANHPGYDEYRYDIGDIGHDPQMLMAYLSARFRDFTFADVEAELQSMFAEQYQLTFTPEVEIRTRTVTSTDPITGETTEDEEEYEWHILNIALTSKPFADVILPRMSDDEREIYDLIMDTGGNRQYTFSPFEFDWLPYVTSHYGWRLHPITGVREFHTGIDMGVPTGTAVVAGHDGVVSSTVYGSTGYGYQIVLNGENGVQTRYAHLNEILVTEGQEVKAGDLIGRVGSTGDSTGPHLHYEVIVNGNFLNPIFFAHTNVV